jgi:hypothetical protein
LQFITRTFKRRVVIHNDRETLRSAVINNLVPEEKREIIFSTQIPEDQPKINGNSEDISVNMKIEERIEKLELIVKKLVEYLVKENA